MCCCLLLPPFSSETYACTSEHSKMQAGGAPSWQVRSEASMHVHYPGEDCTLMSDKPRGDGLAQHEHSLEVMEG